ncbi:MAG TPA: glycine--tRNA ligase subunit beta [Nitrospirae bacterium]|nr:glycine--tRNA ligase subunit beta [Nitrospirota bacterium]
MINQTFHTLLFEIGTEEIPARFIPLGISRLKELAERFFSEYRLEFKSLNTYGTPRRLSVIADIAEIQRVSEREVWGPPVHVAFDKNDNLTRAGEVFLKNNNISINEILKKEKNKGLYITAIIKEEAKPIFDLLPEILNKIIQSLNFPKSMRWGNGNLRFVRPIHWILCIYNNKKFSFELEGIKTSNMTRGHRFLAPAAFEVKDTRTYINLLRNNYVIVDRKERKSIIVESSEALAKSVNCIFVHDMELLEHVTDLVEYPQAMLGTFPEEYLDLPEELLIIVMKDHQKYFALRTKQNKLSNHFIVVSNTRVENKVTVIKGAQKVLKARFEDARFYYDDDKKTTLKDRIDGLKKVVYHEKLGSLYDKSKRIEDIATFLSERLCPENTPHVKITASLCKADLITGIVREFPELQGVMGSYYARHEAYNSEIVSALKEQYLPRNANDLLPQNETARMISMADKTDNLVSFFSIGEIPSSTEDPFGLRRNCYAIAQILIAGKYKISAYELFNYALTNCHNKQQVLAELLRFFEQRIEFYMQNAGYPQDIINSLLFYSTKIPLYSLIIRAEALKTFRDKAYYNSLLLGLKRVYNIAPKSDFKPLINNSLFFETEERILYDNYSQLQKEIEGLVNDERFIDAIDRIASLETSINDFFDKVLVMDKRDEIRHNRLSMLFNIKKMTLQIADFSKLF